MSYIIRLVLNRGVFYPCGKCLLYNLGGENETIKKKQKINNETAKTTDFMRQCVMSMMNVMLDRL